MENGDDSMATVHSAKEDLGEQFYFKDEIVNKYKTQLIKQKI